MHVQISALHQQTTYRPDIDGLRAVAVLSVLAYHYGAPFPWPLLPGGFTGVDVFFVISGFLITSKLADDIRAGTFSILGFYDRRVRRILPALIVMLAITMLAGKFLLIPGDYKAAADSTAAAAFGVSNFFFLTNTGYFDQSADLMPLLHTWSLAVEEQFYVVWPLLLFVIAAGRKRIDDAAIIGAIVIIGFGLSLIWFDADPKAAFFMAAPRAWELAIGAALVFLPPLPRWLGGATGLGLVLIAAGFLRIEAASFPGIAALLPCVGAALVIWPQREPTRTAKWLGRLSPIGLISYSLYLWHWPVWVMFRVYINNGTPRIREAIALALVSIALAILSYRYVERPFRKRRWQPGQSVWAGLAACALIFCGAMYIDRADGLPSRISPDVYAMRSLDAMWDWPCQSTTIDPSIAPLCVFGSPWNGAATKAVLWGDSNAEQFAPFLDELAKRSGVSVALQLPCASVLDDQTLYDWDKLGPNYNRDCQLANANFLEFIAGRHDINTVILAASWQSLMSHLKGQGASAALDTGNLLGGSLTRIAVRLRGAGKQLVVIATIPQWGIDPIPCALLNEGLLRRQCSDDDRALTTVFYHASHRASLDVFRQFAAANPDVKLIVPGDGACGTNPRCSVEINGEFIYRDAAHLRRNLSKETDGDLARLIGLYGIFHE
jgi:peptidoglycan/LPS O-acetylase OafA/YrhL